MRAHQQLDILAQRIFDFTGYKLPIYIHQQFYKIINFFSANTISL